MQGDVLTEAPAQKAVLRASADKPLLRFITCGSVDDGKSTLIGRLLYDADLAPVSQHRDEATFDAQVVAGTQARGLRAHRALGRRIGTLAHLQGLGH